MNNKKGCIATDRISKDKCKVGYMYREEPYKMFDDSGWRFFEGTEDQEYMSIPENSSVHELEEICKIDESIIPYLDSEVGTSFYRDENGNFIEEEKDY